jgi:hypothetical protein
MDFERERRLPLVKKLLSGFAADASLSSSASRSGVGWSSGVLGRTVYCSRRSRTFSSRRNSISFEFCDLSSWMRSDSSSSSSTVTSGFSRSESMVEMLA